MFSTTSLLPRFSRSHLIYHISTSTFSLPLLLFHVFLVYILSTTSSLRHFLCHIFSTKSLRPHLLPFTLLHLLCHIFSSTSPRPHSTFTSFSLYLIYHILSTTPPVPRLAYIFFTTSSSTYPPLHYFTISMSLLLHLHKIFHISSPIFFCTSPIHYSSHLLYTLSHLLLPHLPPSPHLPLPELLLYSFSSLCFQNITLNTSPFLHTLSSSTSTLSYYLHYIFPPNFLFPTAHASPLPTPCLPKPSPPLSPPPPSCSLSLEYKFLILFPLGLVLGSSCSLSLAFPEPEFVNIIRSPGIDSQPGGSVLQPYLTYRSARLHRLTESITWNQFLGSLNVYKFGLCS
jgi:hypothetical protein